MAVNTEGKIGPDGPHINDGDELIAQAGAMLPAASAPRVIAVVPAFNEEITIASVVLGALAYVD